MGIEKQADISVDLKRYPYMDPNKKGIYTPIYSR